jgi:hypothetical protein
VQNHDKTAFVRAEPANTTAALRAVLAEVPEDLTFDRADKPDKEKCPVPSRANQSIVKVDAR